jgi:hypothetical protein
LESARLGYTATLQEYLTGKCTLDRLMAWSGRVLEARRTAAGKDADPTPFLEEYWRQALAYEEVSRVKWEAAKIGTADFLDARVVRLRAETAWVKARGEHGAAPAAPLASFEIRVNAIEPLDALGELAEQQVRARTQFEALRRPPADVLSSRSFRLDAAAALLCAGGIRVKPGGPTAVLDLPQDDPLEATPRAKAAFSVARADAKELDGLKVAVARDGFRASEREFAAGKAALAQPLAWSLRLLEAERAVSDRKEDQTAAFERHWSRLCEIESATARKMAEGRVGISDFMAVRCERLQAETRWLEARTK